MKGQSAFSRHLLHLCAADKPAGTTKAAGMGGVQCAAAAAATKSYDLFYLSFDSYFFAAVRCCMGRNNCLLIHRQQASNEDEIKEEIK